MDNWVIKSPLQISDWKRLLSIYIHSTSQNYSFMTLIHAPTQKVFQLKHLLQMLLQGQIFIGKWQNIWTFMFHIWCDIKVVVAIDLKITNQTYPDLDKKRQTFPQYKWHNDRRGDRRTLLWLGLLLSRISDSTNVELNFPAKDRESWVLCKTVRICC